MKLTLQDIYGSTIVLASIISNQRPMPQRGKYLTARLHSKLLPEFNLVNARRNDLIKAYNNPKMKTETLADGTVSITQDGDEWLVPDGKMPEFLAAWKTVGEEEIEVDVQPIPLTSLSLPNGSDGAIESYELATLGDLIYDNAN